MHCEDVVDVEGGTRAQPGLVGRSELTERGRVEPRRRGVFVIDRHDSDRRGPARDAFELNEGVLLARPFHSVWPVELDCAAHRLLLSIAHGESVAHAVLTAAELHPRADVGALFASLVNAGAFAALSFERTVR